MKLFEKEFLLGAAGAGHQTEGNNIHSDCWAMENMPHSDYLEPSLDACQHYERYPEDIQLMKEAGMNAYRFSIEWSRIEPEEGQFDEKELQHYKDVIACCKASGIEPVVTLFHFASPVWLIRKGGWEADTTPVDFARYVRYLMENLGQDLKYVITINEANMGMLIAGYEKEFQRALEKQAAAGTLQIGIDMERMEANKAFSMKENEEVFGTPTPQIFTSPRSAEGDLIVMKAHDAARKVIREVCPWIQVGLSLSVYDLHPLPGCEKQAEAEWDHQFAHYLPFIDGDDFLGVQNYTRSFVDQEGCLPVPEGASVTQMGYELYPQSLENVLRKIAPVFKGSLLVTENGVATDDDEIRQAFITEATAGTARCIQDGLPIIGYMYWSFLDNYEWQKAYTMTFGLVEVDRQSKERRPKPSLQLFSKLR